jgi:hypothetical protein
MSIVEISKEKGNYQKKGKKPALISFNIGE